MERSISIQIETVEVKAKPRRLERRHRIRWRGKRMFYIKPLVWSIEPSRNIVSHYGLDSEDKLTNAYMTGIPN